MPRDPHLVCRIFILCHWWVFSSYGIWLIQWLFFICWYCYLGRKVREPRYYVKVTVHKLWVLLIIFVGHSRFYGFVKFKIFLLYHKAEAHPALPKMEMKLPVDQPFSLSRALPGNDTYSCTYMYGIPISTAYVGTVCTVHTCICVHEE